MQKKNDLLYKPHRFIMKSDNPKINNLHCVAWGTKEEAAKEIADWVESEKTLKGARIKEVVWGVR